MPSNYFIVFISFYPFNLKHMLVCEIRKLDVNQMIITPSYLEALSGETLRFINMFGWQLWIGNEF